MNCLSKFAPAFFATLVVRLLHAMGYGASVAEISKAPAGGSGDGGVDGVIDHGILGLDRIFVQAKRDARANTIGPGSKRDFFGSLERFKATKGLFVTASAYTPPARGAASLLSKRIIPIDDGKLTRLMIEHNLGCRVEETLEIKKMNEWVFE